MDSAGRLPGPAALGAVLGLLSVTELAIRLTVKSTVHAELAPGPPVHAGINLPTALLMGAFCLLATVPAGWLRPLPAALAVYVAARGERARIARELHDVVAHHISMIAVQAETGRLTTPGLPDAGAQRFAAIGDTARAGLTEMRRLLGVLREDAEQDQEPQPDLEPAGPARPGADRRPQPGLPQLGDLVDGARDASGSVVRLIMSGQAARLDPGVELAAYRIMQEALTNARRHAPGAAVDVELRYADDALRLRIRDNGPGQAARYHAGHGLLGMRERAAAVGGSLQTGDARGGGFLVEAELPAKAPDALTGTPPERMH